MADSYFSGVSAFAAAVDRIMAKAQAASAAALAEAAKAVRDQARTDASGRPGPNIVSGSLRNSIVVDGPRADGLGWVAFVGPTAPYGRRVELGFHGADSLGRVYDQTGFPYMEPAFHEVERVALPALYRKWWGEAVRP